MQVLIKKEVSSSKRRALREIDRRRLESRIPTTSHRGLRMLCSNQLLNLTIDCTVNTTASEYMCAKMKSISLDLGKITEFVTPILKNLVNEDEDAAFDQIGKPLL
jgi:uncharacterized membrane protein YheB (UPF0754 family)